MKRAFKAVMSGIAYAANFWWAGVAYMVTGIDITDPEERADVG